MSKHTQGEWYVSAGLQVVSKNGNIAKVWAKGNGEGSANARLIAAAPELLEACEAFVKWSEAELNGNGTTFWERVEMSNNVDLLMKAAIAKAIGE